jgi:hypothetical protein
MHIGQILPGSLAVRTAIAVDLDGRGARFHGAQALHGTRPSQPEFGCRNGETPLTGLKPAARHHALNWNSKIVMVRRFHARSAAIRQEGTACPGRFIAMTEVRAMVGIGFPIQVSRPDRLAALIVSVRG